MQLPLVQPTGNWPKAEVLVGVVGEGRLQRHLNHITPDLEAQGEEEEEEEREEEKMHPIIIVTLVRQEMVVTVAVAVVEKIRGESKIRAAPAGGNSATMAGVGTGGSLPIAMVAMADKAHNLRTYGTY